MIEISKEERIRYGKRISAWASLMSGADGKLIQRYHGDLVHDGSILLGEGPFAALVYENGTHMSEDPEWMESVRRNFGAEEEGRRHWFFGYGCEYRGEYTFTFEKVTAEQAISRLRNAQVIAQENAQREKVTA